MNDFIKIRRFSKIIYLETRDKEYNLRLAVTQR